MPFRFRLPEGSRAFDFEKWLRAPIVIPALGVLVLAGYFASRGFFHAKPVPPPRSAAPVTAAAVPRPTRETPSSSAIFGPPHSLTEIYNRSSESVRTIHSDDWDTSNQQAEDLYQVVESFFNQHQPLPPAVASPYVIDDLVGKVLELQSAVDQRDRLKAELAANRISGLTIDMLSHYDWKMPLALARLDYLGSDVVIWSDAGNESMARRRLDRMRAEWQQVRPAIIKRGGATEAEGFDRVLSQLTKAKNTAQMQTLSDDLLNGLAALQALFD